MLTDVKNKVTEKVVFKDPDYYKVIMHNDDSTPLDYVVMMQVAVFSLPIQEAITNAMEAHNNSFVVLGSFIDSKAQLLKDEGENYINQMGYGDFKMTLEKEN